MLVKGCINNMHVFQASTKRKHMFSLPQECIVSVSMLFGSCVSLEVDGIATGNVEECASALSVVNKGKYWSGVNIAQHHLMALNNVDE